MTSLPLPSTLARRLDVIVLAGAAWLWLAIALWPRAFDPSSAQFLCFGVLQAGQALAPQVLLGLANTSLHFLVMGAAMMLPTTAWLAAPDERAGRTQWIAGYLVVWCAVGLVAAAAVQAAALLLPEAGRRSWASVLPQALCMLAAAYQVCAWRARRFGAMPVTGAAMSGPSRAKTCPCSKTNTPPQFAPHPDPTAWRVGLHSGAACAVRCAPFMLALHALDPSSLTLMVAGTALMFVERWHYRIGSALTAACLVGAAAFTVVA